MENLNLILVSYDHPDLRGLISNLDSELLLRYPEEEIFGLDFNDPQITDTAFALAYSNSKPVGCGALRPLDKTNTELKRLFVEQSYRQKGIASKIITFLEETAGSMGYTFIR